MRYVPSRVACAILGLCPNTLRKYADEGRIPFIRNSAGQRSYDVDAYIGKKRNAAVICYCRVSSQKQKDDLARQVARMREAFPRAEIIKDIGSGLNFKRKGLRAILERILRGDKLTLVVAHRDRLFGFEIIELLVRQDGGEIMVLDSGDQSPEDELTRDLLAILHVFSCRMHGLRRYADKIKKDKTLSKP